MILVCTADKIILVDAMYGANLNASFATCAKRIINGCEIVLHLNRTVRACLLTLHTTNASVGAKLASESALIVVRALNNNLYGVVYKLDDVVGERTYRNQCTFAGLPQQFRFPRELHLGDKRGYSHRSRDKHNHRSCHRYTADLLLHSS